jgi:predicted RNase H-like nuclease (RuvC/YqgF family)
MKPTLVLIGLAVLAGIMAPHIAVAQRGYDRGQFDARMNVLERSMAELSLQLERLKASNQALERKLDAMRANFDQRLEGLERRPAPAGRARP